MNSQHFVSKMSTSPWRPDFSDLQSTPLDIRRADWAFTFWNVKRLCSGVHVWSKLIGSADIEPQVISVAPWDESISLVSLARRGWNLQHDWCAGYVALCPFCTVRDPSSSPIWSGIFSPAIFYRYHNNIVSICELRDIPTALTCVLSCLRRLNCDDQASFSNNLCRRRSVYKICKLAFVIERLDEL